jgi:hypothetical protein
MPSGPPEDPPEEPESPLPSPRRVFLGALSCLALCCALVAGWYFLVYLRPASFRKLRRVLDHQGATISVVQSYGANPPLKIRTLSPQESGRLRLELKRRMPFTIKPHIPLLDEAYCGDVLMAVIRVDSGRESSDVAILDHEFSADPEAEAHQRIEFRGMLQLLAEMERTSAPRSQK